MSTYGLEVIPRSECLELLASQSVGRVGVGGVRPGIFPVVFAMLDGDIVFRTAPGEKLIAAALHRDVVFEVDRYDVESRTGWSVNVIGIIEELREPAARDRAEALELEPWAGEWRDRYCAVRTRDVTGRRIRTN